CALTPNTDVERVDDQGLTSTNDQAIEQLKDAFDQKCLDLIESAFEGTTTYNCGYYDGANRAAAEMYGESIGAKERLTRICNNIISNGGAFVIPNVGSF
ncbi:hypothetical protein ACKI16_46075, partial [Streptomyces scabiei]|uniref:hypothetical protein n=1 Tax=Streptomyces scabiei TaxID=1930 RepID=UPI0038F5E02E